MHMKQTALNTFSGFAFAATQTAADYTRSLTERMSNAILAGMTGPAEQPAYAYATAGTKYAAQK